MSFVLDPRLADSGILLGETDAYVVNLANDQRYPWVILIPKINGISEIYQMSALQQSDLWRVSSQLGQELMGLFEGDKFNVAAIGNIVSQLHVHHIVRYESDPAWPQPVWGRGDAIEYEAHQRELRVSLLRSSLSLLKL